MTDTLQVLPIHLTCGLSVLLISNGAIVLDAKHLKYLQVDYFGRYKATISRDSVIIENLVEETEKTVYPLYKMFNPDRMIKKWLRSYDMDVRRN